MQNLVWDGVPDINSTVALPCMARKQPVSRWKLRSGKMSPASRWKLRGDLDEAQCTNDLHDMTVTAFKLALEASNDDNELLRDIFLWNDRPEDGCHEDDYEAFGFLIMTSDGCFENVHPNYL